MVRLKQRYILFDILTPPTSVIPSSPEDTLVALCQASPASITPKLISQVIRKLIQDNYGDFGLGMASMLVAVKYFNNRTSLGIIRCSRQSFPLVMASLTLTERIADHPVLIRCVHVSGTIKKCEEFAIQKNRAIIAALSTKAKKTNKKYDNVINNFKEEAKTGALLNLDDHEE